MKKIIIHIGHGKTGSSYLQSVLALNRDNLLSLGIDYPLHKSFKKAKQGKITSGNGQVLEEYYGKLDSFSDKDKIIFSDERFCRDLISSKYNWFLEFLKKYSSKLTIIVYSRNLFEHAFSLWAQSTKRQGNVLDINAYLQKTNSFIYEKVLFWLNLSDEFKFKIVFRNYSNHKENLLNIFLKDILNKEDLDKSFILPKNNQVNRSLTFSEYEIQRICNYLNVRKLALSDLLVNELPEVKSMELKCDRKTYEFVKEKNLKIINEVNSRIDKKESINIEPPEKVVYENDDRTYETLSLNQIKIISRYIQKATLDPIFVDQIIKIALKIESNQSLDLSNALSLMKIAQVLKPEGPFIKSKIEAWESELNQKL